MQNIIDADKILNLYLFGYLDMPLRPEQRYRSSSDIFANPNFVPTVNTTSYMQSVGRFAKLGDAPLVRAFFDGNVSRQGITDQNGTTRIKISDMLASNFAQSEDIRFTISNYSAGVSDDDFAIRAFIWGSSSYRLSDQTTLAWDANGNKFIEHGSIRPFDDNFDFNTSTDNVFIQTINSEILKPRIDPYDIGHLVNLTFDAESKDIWDQSNYDNIYTQLDYSAYSKPSYVYDSVASLLSEAAGAFSSYANGISALQTFLSQNEAVSYIDKDGRDIIYGSDDDDILSYSSHKGENSGSDPYERGAYFVGADGNDTITGGDKSDILSGGQGDNILVGGAGDDILISGSGSNLLYGGQGADTFWLEKQVITQVDWTELLRPRMWSGEEWESPANSALASAETVIKDADKADKLFWNGYNLTGGTFQIIDVNPGPNPNKFDATRLVGAYVDSIGSIYQVDQETHNLWIYLPDNTTTIVENWNNGIAGISLADPLNNNSYNSTWVWRDHVRASIADDGISMNIDELPARFSSNFDKGLYDLYSAQIFTADAPVADQQDEFGFNVGWFPSPDFVSMMYQFEAPEFNI